MQTLYSLSACSINTNLAQYTTKHAANICQDELIDYLLENNSSNGKYKTYIAPNRTEDNPIYFAISIEKITNMNAELEVTELMAYALIRWNDWRLTWNADEWAGIDMVYLPLSMIWKPDLKIYNEMSTDNKEFLFSDNSGLVRVYAAKSKMSDLKDFNIEWSPHFNLQVFHSYGLRKYPVDEQLIVIDVYSWMSLQGHGACSMHLLSSASTQLPDDLVFQEYLQENEDDRFMLDFGLSSIKLHSYMWAELEFSYLRVQIHMTRTNFQYFTIIYLQLVCILILVTLNVIYGHNETKLSNAIALLISSSVYYTIFYEVVKGNRSFGVFEVTLLADSIVTFVSNVMSIIEYHYTYECEKLKNYADTFIVKGSSLNDDIISNKLRYRYRIKFQTYKYWNVLLNIIVIAVNFVVITTTISEKYQYLMYISNIIIGFFLIYFIIKYRQLYYDLNTVNFICRVQYTHSKYSKEIDQALEQAFDLTNYSNDSIINVAQKLSKCYKDKKYMTDQELYDYERSFRYIIKPYSYLKDNTTVIEKKELKLILYSLKYFLKEADDLHKYIEKEKILEAEKKMVTNFSLDNLEYIDIDNHKPTIVKYKK